MQTRPCVQLVVVRHRSVGWQWPSSQNPFGRDAMVPGTPLTQSESMKQRGSSRQIDNEQSKPGGHSFWPNFWHSELGPHVADELQVSNARHLPKVPLVQYWPSGQSAFVLQSAAAQRPSRQTTPSAVHVMSVVQRLAQVPVRHA